MIGGRENYLPCPSMSDSAWKVFQLDELVPRVQGDDPCFLEFLRMPSLSLALYRLPAGSKDMQAPHLEDEIYYVVDGRATLRVSGEEKEASAGTILYVRATEEHSFFNITEDLTLLAFFGKADLSVK
ncbi:MAG TPA: cupin domain-containing protein [Gammaproteobacteria bacterium]|jgi:mannose-6-phosphate isomerase-like protein (cupin superfamily)|nr:cupin domain-containing protein [Gammaproteobacteria bacterium]